MSRRLKYVMFSDAWWDEKRGGRRHRGRPRPLARLRYIFPRHCSCENLHARNWAAALFDLHTAKTVLPRGGGRRYGWYDPKFITMVGTVDPL